MEKITLPKASQLTSPNPVTLVCTKKSDGSTNVATVSWWTYLSFQPETVGFAMAQTSYSGERLRETGEVVITVPTEEIAEEVMQCGMVSGRQEDKVQKTNLQMQALPGTDIQVPVHSKVAIVGKLKEFHEVGDHYLYICEVEQVYGDPEKTAVFAWNGYGEIRTAK